VAANLKYLTYAGIGLGVVLLQVLFSRFLSIAGASPDFVLIYLVYLTLREGQFVGETSGFVLGIFLDIFSSGILGAHTLSYTVACFLIGFFYNEEKIEQMIRNWPFLLLTLLAAVLNNFLFYFLYTRASEISFEEFAFRYGAVAALYTVVIAILPLLYWSRRRAY
jgi:rod shape-determining protein MreD